MRDCNMCPGPGFDPTEQTGPVYLGGVLGIDVNGVRQPIDAEGVVTLQVDAQAAADSAAAAADSAAEALRWAVQSAENARLSRGYAENSNTILGVVMQYEADTEVAASDAEESATQAAGSATAAAASAAAAQTAAERDVPAAAAAWLSENVDPATGYVLDDSLSVENAAADAKAVGDATEKLDKLASIVPYGYEKNVVWESGAWNNSGNKTANNAYARTSDLVPITNGLTIVPTNTITRIRYRLIFFDSNLAKVTTYTRAFLYDTLVLADVTPSNAVYVAIDATVWSDAYTPITASTAAAIGATIRLTDSRGSTIGAIHTLQTSFQNQLAGRIDWSGKTVAIIGDSISCHGNYSASNLLGNVPELVIDSADVGIQLSAYATYYDIGTTIGSKTIAAADVGTEVTVTPTASDVGKVLGKPRNTNDVTTPWWLVAANTLGFTPRPVAWSGASISSHEGGTDILKASYAWHPATIRKCGIRTPGTMERTAPDVIIIARGTNDISHAPYDTLTADFFTGYRESMPQTDTVSGGYGFKESLSVTIQTLRNAYPSARIILCTLNFFRRSTMGFDGYPTRNGIGTLQQYNQAIREAADFYGCDLIEFAKDGLTYELASTERATWYQDGTGNETHPTQAGHTVLGNRAIRDLLKINAME